MVMDQAKAAVVRVSALPVEALDMFLFLVVVRKIVFVIEKVVPESQVVLYADEDADGAIKIRALDRADVAPQGNIFMIGVVVIVVDDVKQDEIIVAVDDLDGGKVLSSVVAISKSASFRVVAELDAEIMEVFKPALNPFTFVVACVGVCCKALGVLVVLGRALVLEVANVQAEKDLQIVKNVTALKEAVPLVVVVR